MTDNDLMESVLADNYDHAIAAPASTPRRDSMEDADSSLTRKRPRLDIGPQSDRSNMSAEPNSGGNSPTQPTAELVAMTLNLRPPPTLSLQPADTAAIPNGLMGTTPTTNKPASPVSDVGPDTPPPEDQDPSEESPQIQLVEDDESAGVSLEDYSNSTFIHMDEEYHSPERHFDQFPFIDQFPAYMDALRGLTTHIATSRQIEASVLPRITTWLEAIPNLPSRWTEYYSDHILFWEEFSSFVQRVLTRKWPFGISEEGDSEEQIVYRFLRSYLRLCARLFQVDALVLSKWTGDAPYDGPLVSFRHLRILTALVHADRPLLFQVLAKEHRVEIRTFSQALLREFVKTPVHGTRHLLSFAEQARDKMTPPAQHNVVLLVFPVIERLIWLIPEIRDIDAHFDRSHFHRRALQLFRKYNEDLQVPGKIPDAGATKECLIYSADLLYAIASHDEELAVELGNEFLEFSDPNSDPQAALRKETFERDTENLPNMIFNAYKFTLLKKYVLKGKMELRVVSIGIMDAALVDIWREYNGSAEGTSHPVMQYLADFLLRERVVDYIISVDSHPQLISRSGNIVGFLVVTHRYSERQTDAIWNTVSNSPDPRVVSATLAMLRGIVNLMDVIQVQYLCTKLYDLPIESYNLEILRFLREFSGKMQEKPVDEQMGDPKARPANVCLRVIQDTAPSRTSTKSTLALHTEASEQLRILASSGAVGRSGRKHIYEACVQEIAEKTSKATGSIHAILELCSSPGFEDIRFLIGTLGATCIVVEEFCVFVKAETTQGPYPFQHSAMKVRLDLLASLMLAAPESVPINLYEDLWEHLVGRHALDNTMRDVAWEKLAYHAKYRPQDPFCSGIVTQLIPHLEPVYFTSGLFKFITQVTNPSTKQTVTSSDGIESLKISGADLLWRLILTAPPGTVEDLAARLLAHRYIEVTRLDGVTLEEVEEAHIALAEQCSNRLLASFDIIRRGDPSEASLQEHKLGFTRTLLFEKLILQFIRGKPDFTRVQRRNSQSHMPSPPVLQGDAITIKFQVFGGTTEEKKSLLIGKENTLGDLYNRFCQLTGFTKLSMIAGGRRLDLNTESRHRIGDLGLGEHISMLVNKAPDAQIVQRAYDENVGVSAFETTVLKHFEDLYACMDSDDHISESVYDFLSCFRHADKIGEAVASGSASSDDIFPPGKVFQAEYAAIALQEKLRVQLSKGSINETFLANAIRILDNALLNDALISSTLSGRRDVHLAGVIVSVLLGLLKERPLQNVSAQYFSNEAQLVDRLVTILSASLTTHYDNNKLVCDCYATILEASLHSKKVWDAFWERPDIVEIHRTLLLTDPRRPLRVGIVQSIASVCGGHLPFSSPVKGTETASRYWHLISSILPEAVYYPCQATELFGIAEQVFRRNDENNRDEDSLRSCLKSWGSLLLEYKHKEFVGREEVDPVIMGFTKLLLCCIPSLKSFKKPLHAGSLLEKLFLKFLFVPMREKLQPTENGAMQLELPVLESGTRKELYNLVLALVEDQTSYDKLLGLAQSLLYDDDRMVEMGWSIERSSEIRSSTGYVGLVNPRALCYMNSLLTQLFMNLNFRKFMLEVNVADPSGSQRLIAQTQDLFAMMQNSFRKAADPRDFAACVKGLDSQPIDVNIQMDADEFYNLLFDQWEGQMLSQDTKQQFRTFYGGRTVNQIKSKECEHVSERVESFFVVQCDVQGKANLQESLQAFVEGDVMEGDNKYKCESCGGKFVDAVKRTCLKDVPDNLIFHLKRFDFDIAEMRRTKINDFFEFPEQIDVSPYKIDHLSDPSKPKQEDLFELVGVLVHAGTSENGHYYSFIRERPSPSGSSNSWVEYNDREVNEFEPSNIGFQAFGGCYDGFQNQQKPFSAYMLFYQRKSSIDGDRQKYMNSPDPGPPKVPVPDNLELLIANDNEEFLKEYCLFDPNHSKFIRQILATLRTVNHGTCSEDHGEEKRTIHVVLENLYQILSRLREVIDLEEAMGQLRKTLLSCTICCRTGLMWMANHQYALSSLLLRCPHQKIRGHVRSLLLDGLCFLRDKDPASYGVDVDTDMETGATVSDDGVLAQVVDRLSVLAQKSWISTRGWDDFYMALCQLSSMGRLETAVLLDKKILEFCLGVLCMQAEPSLQRIHYDLWRMIREKRKPVFNMLIEFIYYMLTKMDFHMEPVSNHISSRWDTYIRSTSKFPFTKEEDRLLHLWHEDNRAYAVLDKMIEVFDITRSPDFFPGEVLKLMLTDPDGRVQYRLHVSIYEGINSLTPPLSDPYVRAAIYYCQASPSLKYTGSIIDGVVNSASKLKDSGGEVHLEFFNSLLTLRNETLFEEAGPDYFYDQALQKTLCCTGALLMYDDDNVRKDAARLIERIYITSRPDDVANPESIQYKYVAIRRMIRDFTRKICTEYEAGTLRAYMQPMIQICDILAQTLMQLLQNADPAMEPYQHSTDVGLLHAYNHDVTTRTANWLIEEDTILSSAEAFDQSDYGSDSDDGLELDS
ncbi:hypothetical protein GQ43DRAFT_481180 [Delitschia confertaspora ATCC 74209]|uniref:USP domain-containing protein n=1 Tax=Delitschia confertaspora ATCC 74209 TaxID=1513339 RepID=A0A9P4JQS6_9PLEO|nr:hypothetical protein GQ43DRAFT_481180 [Delitschia confertaspora ATCC 74209]